VSDTTVSDVLAEADESMKAVVAGFEKDLCRVRTGRATVALLDGINVNYYGTETPLSQVASLAAPDANLLTAKPWEPGLIPEIEKAIQKADLGLNPQNDGKIIRLPIPALTEERRKKLARQVSRLAEERKTRVRQHRREANEAIKAMKKEGLSEDEEKRAQSEVQKTTDKYVALVEEARADKEKEIMTL